MSNGYYLKYDGRTIGPIAPDNPEWTWDDPRMMFKCQKFAKEMNAQYNTDYEVTREDS